MNKKVTLLELVATKTIYAGLIAVYFWMCARRDWNDYYSTIQYAVAVFTVVFLVYQIMRISKYNKEIVDELAEQNLNRANSICMKITGIALVIIAFAGALEFLSNIMMGYTIVGLLIVIAIFRTIIFYIMDVKGV